MSIASRIKELREARGLTQSQLAKLVKVSQSSVGNWEAGIRQMPRGDTLILLSRALGVEPGRLTFDQSTTIAETSDELRLLSVYRDLPEDRKTLAIKILQSLK